MSSTHCPSYTTAHTTAERKQIGHNINSQDTIHLSIYLPTYLPLPTYLYLPTYLSICLFIDVFIAYLCRHQRIFNQGYIGLHFSSFAWCQICTYRESLGRQKNEAKYYAHSVTQFSIIVLCHNRQNESAHLMTCNR